MYIDNVVKAGKHIFLMKTSFYSPYLGPRSV